MKPSDYLKLDSALRVEHGAFRSSSKAKPVESEPEKEKSNDEIFNEVFKDYVPGLNRLLRAMEAEEEKVVPLLTSSDNLHTIADAMRYAVDTTAKWSDARLQRRHEIIKERGVKHYYRMMFTVLVISSIINLSIRGILLYAMFRLAGWVLL